MDSQATQHPIRIRDGIEAAYGDRLERVLLFGSCARGDCHPNSDYDAAVFLHDMGSLWELWPLPQLAAEILADTGEFISAKPFRPASYRDAHPLMVAIRRGKVYGAKAAGLLRDSAAL